ncbi:MAG TPA: M20/M25/M40 family metallo-hydrolase, partial [Candidatus Saccharimonas sp.]|nr:M20/M25/M40 family metallo-hydrolase [Candidatus Saccharimonas sp.]
KGGIATILAAVAQTGAQSGLTLLFYCDEEYDFAGMRAFLAQEPAGPRPELALIAEPSNGYIWNAHRGLIELHLAVGGRTGHAANPAAGINAITSLADVLRDLAGWLNRFDSPALGRPSLNVAYLRGGLNRGQPGGEVELGRDGNNIADYAEAILDIRPTLPSLRAAAVVAQVQELVTTAKLELLAADIRHDLGALATDPANLVTLEAIVSGGYLDGRDRGYGDGQLIAEAWDIPVAYLGPAGANAHAADEWVSRRSLRQIAQTYTRIIARYTS